MNFLIWLRHSRIIVRSFKEIGDLAHVHLSIMITLPFTHLIVHMRMSASTVYIETKTTPTFPSSERTGSLRTEPNTSFSSKHPCRTPPKLLARTHHEKNVLRRPGCRKMHHRTSLKLLRTGEPTANLAVNLDYAVRDTNWGRRKA